MANLQFQDFNLGGSDSPFTSANSSQDQRPVGSTNDSSNLVQNDGTDTEAANSKLSFLSFKFYQQYFDVDTEQVYTRILNSFIPRPGSNFIRDHIQPVPDLYGPFWICTTLIFSAAICGNFAQYIESYGTNFRGNDFTLVTGATTMVTCYVLLVPLIIYSVLWYRNTAIQYTYTELLSAFGYSLAIFIPASILWVLHFSWFRWALILVSVVLSGSVLANTVWNAVRSDPNKAVAVGLVVGVVVLHSLLAIGIKEYYFDSVLPSREAVESPAITPGVAAALISEPVHSSSNGTVNGTDFQTPKSEAVNSPTTAMAQKAGKNAANAKNVAKDETKMSTKRPITSASDKSSNGTTL